MASAPLHTRYADLPAYTTKDGSEIRELMHPSQHAVKHQSVAEAVIKPGGETRLHRHLDSEEIYVFLSGRGTMYLAEDSFAVSAGDTVCIAPGTAHRVVNESAEEMKILCSCSPPYSHEKTELL